MKISDLTRYTGETDRSGVIQTPNKWQLKYNHNAHPHLSKTEKIILDTDRHPHAIAKHPYHATMTFHRHVADRPCHIKGVDPHRGGGVYPQPIGDANHPRIIVLATMSITRTAQAEFLNPYRRNTQPQRPNRYRIPS